LLLLANAVTVVVAQVPVSRFAEGRRRVMMVASAGFIFAGACLLTIAAGLNENIAYLTLITAAVAVGVGECFYTTVLTPLVADLEPTNLRGRYMASIGLSWWIGLALAPTLGTQALSRSPATVFLTAAALSTLAAVSVISLEWMLPENARLTPRPKMDAVTAE
jgi:MFS family permease